MNEENQINEKNLLNKLKENIEEINALKERISELESKNTSLNNKIFDLKIQIKILSEIDTKNKNILEEKKLCENQIEQLKSEILNTTRKEKEEKRLIEKELENEIILYKGLHESGLGKVHAAEKILNLNNFQHDYITHLEQQIQKLRNHNDEIISKLKLEHDIHFYNLKLKMMKCLKDIQNNSINKYHKDLEQNSKMNFLYKNQMLNELEKEALLIKELIISKEKYEKTIFEHNQELALYKKVNKDLLEKNNKYMNIIKSINKKYPNIININNSNSFIENNKEIDFSKKKKNKFNKYKLKFSSDDLSEEIKEKQEKIIRNIFKNNNYRECMTNKNYHEDKINKKYFDEYISLKKSYEELIKENKDIKEKLLTLKDKQKMIYTKYSGILNLYDNAINFLLKEEDLNLNNIIINNDIIQSGNYEKLTSWQKYIIVMLLIKQILPLLETSIDENEKINLSKLSRFNFRSIFDKRIDICDNNIIDMTKKGRNKKKFLKNFNSESDININKQIKAMIKNKSFTQNKRLKIFKEIKGKYRPIRFIHIENKFNFNIKSDKDISLTTNKFFE